VKFGKLESTKELEGMSWDMPEPRIEWVNSEKSKSDTKEHFPQVTSGGTMWTIRAWRGKVYPQKDPMRTWPTHYGNQFSSLEFNATHYRIYSPEKMSQWAEQMPKGFLFCPKFPAIVSHFRRFSNCEGPTDDFIEGLLALGENLGPAFLQLPPHYAPKHSEKLIPYLRKWPRELKMAIEFRHPAWFEGGEVAEAVWSEISHLGIGAVISDTAGRRDALHMRLTAPFLLVRYGGYDGHSSDDLRLRNWAKKISELSKKGLEEFHLLVHTTNSEQTPETCIRFSELVKKECGVEIKAPKLYLP
jgi:uncharacterized protein YecE (DUF72 family)